MKAIIEDSHSALALIVVVLLTLLLVIGKLTGEQWVTMAQWVFTAFISGHVVMNAAETLASKPSPLPAANAHGDVHRDGT